MRFAIVSDTHDNIPAIKALIDELKKEKVEFVVHAGDIVAPFAMKEFKVLGVKVYFAFGNNDGERRLLTKIAEDNGWEIGDIVTFPVDNDRGVVYHGTDARIVEVLKNTNYKVVVFGHTHEPKVEWLEDKTIVNPGEVCGYLTGKRTFAIFDDGEISIVEF
jgi:putative phosphoesterase